LLSNGGSGGFSLFQFFLLWIDAIAATNSLLPLLCPSHFFSSSIAKHRLETTREKKRRRRRRRKNEENLVYASECSRATTLNACCFSYSYARCCSNHIK
jgi:hypothetical protein